MKFLKKIVRAGKHQPSPGETVEVTPDRLKHWAETAQQMLDEGLLIPAPYYHDAEIAPVRNKGTVQDAHAGKNAGFWTRIFVDEDGWIAGELEAATPEDAERIGTAARGCSLLALPEFAEGGKVWSDCITHIALTNKPVVKAPDNFQAIALSAETFAADTPEAGKAPDKAGTETETEDDGAGGDDCTTALGLLAELGLALPEDTCEDNFLERLIVAATAVLSFKKQEGGDVTQPPKGAKEQKPAPIAMSHEIDFAVEQLNAANALDPTGQPWTAETFEAALKAKQPQPAALSAEHQAALNWATDTARADYKRRIEAAVKHGKVTPKYATETLAPMLERLEVRFSADGTRTETELDRLLRAIEAIPDNAVLTGATAKSYAEVRRVGAAEFSLNLAGPNAPKVERQPADLYGVPDPTVPLDPIQSDEIFQEQMRAMGRPTS